MNGYMILRLSALICALVLSLCSGMMVSAQEAGASGEFSLQGRLTTAGGTAVADAQHTLAIKIYNSTTGQVIFSEVDAVTTVDGYFATMIGNNGDGGAELMIDTEHEYELGVSVDGETELSPRITIGSAPKAIAADIAADAKTVAGFSVSTAANPQANTIVALDAQGKLRSSLLDSTFITSINGMSGAVNFQGGGDLSVTTEGNTISLAFTGNGGGLNFPFTRSVNVGIGSAFEITNTLGGSAGSFVNAGLGAALKTQATTGSAIEATSTGSLDGSATIDVENTTGTAISAVAGAQADAALKIRTTASAASAKLISAIDASGTTAFEVAANGKTTIRSTVANALDVGTSAAGEAALKVTGGLSLNGPVGTATLGEGETQVSVNNAFVKANSIIMLTVKSATSAAVPLRIISQGEGSFVVGVFSGLGAVTGDISFNYLIINQ